MMGTVIKFYVFLFMNLRFLSNLKGKVSKMHENKMTNVVSTNIRKSGFESF